MQKLIPLITALFVICCQTQIPILARQEKEKTSASATNECAMMGPLACPVDPIKNLDSNACNQLRSCLEKRLWADGRALTQLSHCDDPVNMGDPFFKDGQIKTLATMNVELELNGPPSHALYLFLKNDRGWCPVAELLEPLWQHGGYCESDVQFKSLDDMQASGGGMILSVERICHMPLDSEEIESGVSDIAEHECVENVYAFSGAGILQLSSSRKDGGCKKP
jgi:hypothetical protein